MDKNVNIEELRAAEKRCWKDEERHQKALHTSANAAIQAYLDGNRSAIQAVSDEDPEIPQDPKGRAKRHRSNGRRSEFRHVDGSVEKITHPTRVADEEIRDFVRSDQALDDSQEDPGEAEKSFRRRKKHKFGTEYASQKPFRKADRLNAAQARKEKKEKKAKKAADKQIKKAEEMAAAAKAATEREEARMSHEPIKYTGATDVAAQTHGKKKAGRLPSRGRRAL